ncbi:MAG: ABC transporter permease, partial [Vicinamibacterales bacterium]
MSWSDRAFRVVVRVLPAELRDAYARDIEITFRAARRGITVDDGAAAPMWGIRLARLWAATVGDLIRTGLSEHLDILRRDLRVALRVMRARPLHTLTALVTLAIGIGANTAMFSVVDAVLLAPLPYRDPSAVVSVQETRLGRDAGTTGYLSFVDVRQRARSFTEMAAPASATATIDDGREAERVSAMRVSHSYFEMLGLLPARGRSFSEADDAPGPARQVVIISDGLWRRRFGGSADAVGRPVFIDGRPFTIVGIMAPTFGDLVSARIYDGAELWMPLGYDRAAPFACRTCRHLRVFGRLAPGMSQEQAEREVTEIYQALERTHPQDYRGAAARITTLGSAFLGPVRPVLLVLWAGVGLLLVVACSNVANLQMLRASERAQEMAVRTSLGVTNGRLIRQMLTESTLLAILAGLLALAPAYTAIRAVALNGPSDIPRIADVFLSGRALLVCSVLTVLAGLMTGIAPVLQVLRAPSHAVLQGAGRRTSSRATWRVRSALVAGNVAMAVVLLVGSALLVRSLLGLLAVAPGFDPSQSVTMQISLSGDRYHSRIDPAQAVARIIGFYEEVLRRARGLPGVESAGAVSTLAMGVNRDRTGFHIEGRPHDNPAAAPNAHRFAVTAGLLQTMRIGLVSGRYLDERDQQTSEPVVVIGRRTAEELFPGENPLGRRVALGPPTGRLRTIVGLVNDVRHEGLDEPPGYQVWVPYLQWRGAETTMTVVLRSSG